MLFPFLFFLVSYLIKRDIILITSITLEHKNNIFLLHLSLHQTCTITVDSGLELNTYLELIAIRETRGAEGGDAALSISNKAVNTC